METIVDRIRSLCREKGTSITKIEVELGYSNGTIGKWSSPNRKAPLEKVLAIAERLETTPEYLMTGEAQKESPPPGGGPSKETLLEMVKASDDEAFLLEVMYAVTARMKEKRGGNEG